MPVWGALVGIQRHQRRRVIPLRLPGLACRHTQFADNSLEEFRAAAELRVTALNHALSGIDPERVRVHICWGNYPGPHHRDVELREVLDIIYTARANAILIEAANPRHAHEWKAFEERPLPDDKILIPGVVESCTPYLEHPQVVADRILRFVQVVGRERVIAGTDCGFATVAMARTQPDFVYAKLTNLAEGARLASSVLWQSQDRIP